MNANQQQPPGRPVATTCSNCGGASLSWHVAKQVYNGVPNGRLTTHDVVPLFVLGCDACSETIAVIDADAVAAILPQLATPASILSRLAVADGPSAS